jgi:hypothetical protein
MATLTILSSPLLSSHHRWGPKATPLESDAYRTRYRIYYSEQVTAGHPDPSSRSEPNKLVVANMDVFIPGVVSSDTISKWQDKSKCPYIQVDS